jgi:hypothetical protein
MDSLYHKKYLKYRQKYLALKNQIGGVVCPHCQNESEYCTCSSLQTLPPHESLQTLPSSLSLQTLPSPESLQTLPSPESSLSLQTLPPPESLQTLPPELFFDIIHTQLKLDDLISLSQTNGGFRSIIQANLDRILYRILSHTATTDEDKEIIQAFIDGTRTNLGMRTISNLIVFRGILRVGIAIIGDEPKFFKITTYNMFLQALVASLSNQAMFNLFGLLIRSYKKIYETATVVNHDRFILGIIDTMNNRMNLHKASCFIQILEYYESLGYFSNNFSNKFIKQQLKISPIQFTLSAFILHIAQFEDQQFSQLLYYTINNRIPIWLVYIIFQNRLTNEQLETTVATFGNLVETVDKFGNLVPNNINYWEVDAFIKELKKRQNIFRCS